MGISNQFMRREASRAHLFKDVWREGIPKVFEDVPLYYDQGNRLASLGLCSWWSDRFVSAMNIPTGGTVLDVCSGTHDILLRLLSKDPTLEVSSIDGSPYMTAEGQRRARKRGLTISAHVCDAHTLPFGDGTFDAVTLQFASRHLRIAEVCKEVHRVLKAGGFFYHNDMLRPASRLIEAPYLLYLRFFVELTAFLFGSSRKSKACVTYFVDAIRHFYTPAEMSRLLEETGFTEIRCKNFLTGALSYHVARKAPR